MPFSHLTDADTTAADGTVFRTCSTNVAHEAPVTLPLTDDNFYRRAGRPFEARCQGCRRERNREVRRLRASGSPVRARRSVTARKFGVEIEFAGASTSAVIRELAARGIACSFEGYNHQVRSAWKLVSDGSLSSGYELVSPPLSGQDGFEQLKAACEGLQAAGARVNRECGLHVHHDVSDLDRDSFGRLFRGWSRNQRNTDMLVAASRRGSRWAAPLSESEVVRIERITSLDQDTVRRYFNGYSVDRYRSLNVACFPRQGTVEVRQHQGSMSYTKIAAWVEFGQAFIAAAVAGNIEASTDTDAMLDQLAAQGALAATTTTYLKGRAAHFSGRTVAA